MTRSHFASLLIGLLIVGAALCAWLILSPQNGRRTEGGKRPSAAATIESEPVVVPASQPLEPLSPVPFEEPELPAAEATELPAAHEATDSTVSPTTQMMLDAKNGKSPGRVLRYRFRKVCEWTGRSWEELAALISDEEKLERFVKVTDSCLHRISQVDSVYGSALFKERREREKRGQYEQAGPGVLDHRGKLIVPPGGHAVISHPGGVGVPHVYYRWHPGESEVLDRLREDVLRAEELSRIEVEKFIQTL